MFGAVAEVVVEGEWQWPSSALGRKMAGMESSLRCAICSEYFNNPQSLSCGHSFCSECIRRHLDQTINPTTSGICPSCRAPAQVSHLRTEKTLFDMMEHFRSARSELIEAVTGAPVAGLSTVEPTGTRKSRGGTVITRKVAQGHFHKQSREVVKKALEKLTEVCIVGSRLRTDGDRDVLERRHKDFVHLHNAQLDSPNPLSLEQVVAEVHRREAARAAESKRMGKSSGVVEKMRNGELTKEANDSFSELIKKVKMKKAQAEVVENNGDEEKATSSKPAGEGNGTDEWRMVKSKTAGKLFYYNTKTKIGQFQCPPEITSLVSPGAVDIEAVSKDSEHISSRLLYKKESEHEYLSSPYQVTASPAEIGKTTMDSCATATPQSAETETRLSDDVEVRIAAAALEDERLQRALKRSLEETTASGKVSEDGERACEPQELCFSGEFQDQDTQWTCGHCTYINEASCPTCDMCMAVKPRSRSSRVASASSQRTQPITASQVSFETPWSKPGGSATRKSSSGEKSGSSSGKRTRRS